MVPVKYNRAIIAAIANLTIRSAFPIFFFMMYNFKLVTHQKYKQEKQNSVTAVTHPLLLYCVRVV